MKRQRLAAFIFVVLLMAGFGGAVLSYESPTPLPVTPYVDANVTISGTSISAQGRSSALSGIQIGPVHVSAERATLNFDLDQTDSLSIRVQRGDTDPVWIRVETSNAILMQRGEDVTILVYGKSGYKLDMHNLTLTDCIEPYEIKCLAEGDIRKIAADEGVSTSPDKQKFVSDLLHWISNTIDFSAYPPLAKQANAIFPPLNAAQIRRGYYDIDRLGGFCGATAVYAAKVLREFGIDAFTVNFGVPTGDLTHVTTVWRDDEGSFYFADPTFNGTFLADGRPADIFRDLDRAEFVGRPITVRHYLFPSQSAQAPDKDGPYANCSENEFGIISCERPDYSIEDYFESFSDSLAAYNLDSGPEAFVFLFRQGIFSAGPALKEGSVDEFFAKAAASGIPIHKKPKPPAS
jgi:hypothetical protein